MDTHEDFGPGWSWSWSHDLSEPQLAQKLHQVFYNSAITKPVVCAHIEAEMGSHLAKIVAVQSHLGQKLSFACKAEPCK